MSHDDHRREGKDCGNRNFAPLTCVLARLKIPNFPTLLSSLVHSKPVPTVQISSSHTRTYAPIRLLTSVRINTSSPRRCAPAPTAQAEWTGRLTQAGAPSDETHARLATPHSSHLLFLCTMSAPTSPLNTPTPTHEHTRASSTFGTSLKLTREEDQLEWSKPESNL